MKYDLSHFQYLGMYGQVFCDPKVPYLLDLLYRSRRGLRKGEIKTFLNTSYYSTDRVLKNLLKYRIIYFKKGKFILYNSQKRIIENMFNGSMMLGNSYFRQPNTL